MCGIVGQLAFGEFNEEMEKTRQESMIFLGSELLQVTQERGKDATGVSLLFDDGNYVGLKMGIPSVEFISKFGKTDKEYGGFIKIWRKASKTGRVFLGHCRQTTRGNALDNNNNHPIKVGEIIGVHNGTIQNDGIIFKKLNCDRTGNVDSESIFRLLHHYTKNGVEPFAINIIKETIQRLSGTFAVLAFSGNNPYQVCAFRDGRPLEMTLIKPLKLVICASDRKFIETSMFRYNKYINLYMPGETRFPTITKGDTESKTLVDDSAVVFDLRTEINKDTEIQELYDWEKIPRNKVWCLNTRENYLQTKTNTNNVPGTDPLVNRKEDNPINNSAGDTKGNHKPAAAGFIHAETGKGEKDNRPPGRIWVRAIDGYAMENSPEVEIAKEIGNIEIDIAASKTNKFPLLLENKKFALENGGKNIENSSPPEPAEVKELYTRTKLTQIPAQNTSVEVNNAKTIEVDASVDVRALEVAEEAVKSVQQYENEEEVLADLEIQDLETLKKIPIASLANRIQKFIFKKGIYKGYLLYKAEEESSDTGSNLFRATYKKRRLAEGNVRVLKTTVKMLLRALTFAGYVNDHTLDKAVVQTLENNEEISSDALNKLFTAGDEREHPFIKRMKNTVSEKEKR